MSSGKDDAGPCSLQYCDAVLGDAYNGSTARYSNQHPTLADPPYADLPPKTLRRLWRVRPKSKEVGGDGGGGGGMGHGEENTDVGREEGKGEWF